MGKLYAIADLHVTYKYNLDAFTEFFNSLPSRLDAGGNTVGNNDDDNDDDFYDFMTFTDTNTNSKRSKKHDFTQDGLILAGDIGEKFEHLRLCFDLATQKFKTVWWVPGNHELYTIPGESKATAHGGAFGTLEESDAQRDARLNHTLRGQARYVECCRIATEYGVLTPEDEFVRWEYEIKEPQSTDIKRLGAIVCPLFTLYDYSFRPPDVSREKVLDWAMEQQTHATDEILLHPDPYPTRDEWCRTLVDKFEKKLTKAQSRGLPLVLINHWPLRDDLIYIPLVPRFTPWCGTKLTEDWHKRFNAIVVVSGHLHVRRTDWRDETRFEEVSLGYPRQWERARQLGRGLPDLIREILPGKQTADQVKKGETIMRVDGR